MWCSQAMLQSCWCLMATLHVLISGNTGFTQKWGGCLSGKGKSAACHQSQGADLLAPYMGPSWQSPGRGWVGSAPQTATASSCTSAALAPSSGGCVLQELKQRVSVPYKLCRIILQKFSKGPSLLLLVLPVVQINTLTVDAKPKRSSLVFKKVPDSKRSR